MKSHLLFCSVVAAMSCTSWAAVGGIYVEYWNAGSSQWENVTGHPDRSKGEAGYSSGSDISINSAGSLVYRVYAYDNISTTDIGVITVSGSGTAPDLMVGQDSSHSLSSASRLDTKGCRDLTAVRQSGGISLDIQVYVDDITGNNDTTAENTDVDRVVRVDADELSGEILTNAGADSSLTNAGGSWFVGDIASTAELICNSGDFLQIRCDGEMAGYIKCTDGTLRDLQVGTSSVNANLTGEIEVFAPVTNPGNAGVIETIYVHGNIGTSTADASIHADERIEDIQAKSIWADIDCGETPGSGSDGVIWKIRAYNDSLNGRIRTGTTHRENQGNDRIEIDGDLHADIVVYDDLEGPIWVRGDLYGDITIGGSTIESSSDASIRGRITVDGIMKSGSTISVGKDLDAYITVKNDEDGNGTGDPAGALIGQVIINEINSTYDWLMNVRIGEASGLPDIVIGPSESGDFVAPHYDELSANIGGGAIGVVPFNMHGTDCSPVNGWVTNQTDDQDGVTIRHYGPIRIDDTGTRCIKIERRSSATSWPDPELGWNDVSSSYSANDISVENGRDLFIDAIFQCAYEYRITPIDGELLCDDVTGDVDVDDYVYGFKINFCEN